MTNCFVMVSFGWLKYIDRYELIYKPAVERAGLEPSYVHYDPNEAAPLHVIERSIRNSEFCLVDISDDNPLVWFQIGYAKALEKKICTICEDGYRHSDIKVDSCGVLYYNKNDVCSAIHNIADVIGEKVKNSYDTFFSDSAECYSIMLEHIMPTREDAEIFRIVQDSLDTKIMIALEDDIYINAERAGRERLSIYESLVNLRKCGLVSSTYEETNTGVPVVVYKILPSEWSVTRE